jgi:hypothetical protein
MVSIGSGAAAPENYTQISITPVQITAIAAGIRLDV